MSEKFSIFVLEGSSSPMLTVKLAGNGPNKPSVQVGRVFISSSKSREQIGLELADIVFSKSVVLSNFFDGKMTLKQKLARKYGQEAGLQMYKLVQRTQAQGRTIANLKIHLDKFDAGTICGFCGTYHAQGTSTLVISKDGVAFCNYGCRDQYYACDQLIHELAEDEQESDSKTE